MSIEKYTYTKIIRTYGTETAISYPTPWEMMTGEGISAPTSLQQAHLLISSPISNVQQQQQLQHQG